MRTRTFSKPLTLVFVMFGIFMYCSAGSLRLFEGAKFVIVGQKDCVSELLGKDLIPRYIKLSKYNRTHHHIYCNFTLPFDFDDNIIIEVNVKRRTPGGLSNVIRFSGHFCEFMDRYIKETIRRVFESGGYKFEKCPLPKGNYTWNTVLDIQLNNMPYVPYGDYESTAFLYRGNRRKVMCTKVLFQIKQKITTNKNDTIFKMDY